MTSREALLQVSALSVRFQRGRLRSPVIAVNDVSLDVLAGETIGLVGESGSGKTTIGRAILGLVRPSDGAVRFDGQDITMAGFRQRRALSADMQIVFQDPYSSLNPRRSIGQTLAEQLTVHRHLSRAAINEQVATALGRVSLPADAAARYPAAFSGGQRQRIAIARALMLAPRFIICDEAVSGLDLSTQAQVLNLLSDLQAELGLSYLFISHDIAVVRYMARRIVVLYNGEVMEAGPTATVTQHPAHPYTRALLAAVPAPDPERQAQRRADRDRQARPASLDSGPLTGCPFAPRCPYVIDRCRTERPLPQAAEGGVTVACHLAPIPSEP
jgi:oligopeptide/dipeptide ABC transporter ATP-binding protein